MDLVSRPRLSGNIYIRLKTMFRIRILVGHRFVEAYDSNLFIRNRVQPFEASGSDLSSEYGFGLETPFLTSVTGSIGFFFGTSSVRFGRGKFLRARKKQFQLIDLFRHLIKSRAVTNWIFSPKRPIFFPSWLRNI